LDHNFHPQVSAVSSGPSAAFPREPVVGIQHNICLSQFEAHISRRMAGYPRYGTRGSKMWLLCTRATACPGRASAPGRASVAGRGLIHAVLVDAGRRRVAVPPYCPAVRSYMRSHPLNLELVPREWRARFGAHGLDCPRAARRSPRTGNERMSGNGRDS
jgi:hypothetical protein